MQVFEDNEHSDDDDPQGALDQESVARLLLKRRMELTAYIGSVVRDMHHSEDIFQDVCVKAIKRYAEFEDETHLIKWTRRVARNRAIDLLRRKDHQALVLDEEILELLEQEWPEEPQDAPSKSIEALRECMGKMTPYSREILRLRYMEGLAGIKVAQTLNRKVDTVYKALTRIHIGLRECVQRRLEKGGEEAFS